LGNADGDGLLKAPKKPAIFKFQRLLEEEKGEIKRAKSKEKTVDRPCFFIFLSLSLSLW
jgi:hypothetical protein